MTENDDRTYIKLHDGMPDHPKVDGLSDKAFRLLVETWCWCSRHLTDGYVPQSTWQKRGTKNTRRELVDAGLVRVNATGGIECHDYLSHQRSAQQVAELREKKKVASAKGNHGKWHVGPRGKPSPTCPWCPHDEDVPSEDPPPDQQEESGQAEMFSPNRIAGAIANASHMGSQNVSDETRETSPETEELLRNSQTETEADPLATRGGSGGSSPESAPADEGKPASRKRSASTNQGHRLPADWAPSDDDRAWLWEKAPALYPHGKEITEAFKDFWLSKTGKDSCKTEWWRAWRNWVRKERGFPGNPPRYDQTGGSTGPAKPSTTDARVSENASRVADLVARRRQNELQQGQTQHQLPGSTG